MGIPNAEIVQQAGHVLRHLTDVVGLVRSVSLADTAVIREDKPEMLDEHRLYKRPVRMIAGETGKEDERFADTVVCVEEIYPVDMSNGHAEVSWSEARSCGIS
jgi:hypothetical protein